MTQFFVKVKNRNEFPITDHYDGVEYVFMPNKITTLPFYVASHFFGLQTPDDVTDRSVIQPYMERRWGWNRAELDRKKAQVYCDKVELSLAVFEMKEVENTDEYLAAPRVKEKAAEAA